MQLRWTHHKNFALQFLQRSPLELHWKGGSDPTLDPNYVAKLKLKCTPGDQISIVEMDPGNFRTF